MYSERISKKLETNLKCVTCDWMFCAGLSVKLVSVHGFLILLMIMTSRYKFYTCVVVGWARKNCGVHQCTRQSLALNYTKINANMFELGVFNVQMRTLNVVT